MSKVYTYDLVGKKEVVLQDGRRMLQCCFTVPDKSFEGLYVEKAYVSPEVVTLLSDDCLFEVGCKCKIFWQRNSYFVDELLVVG